MPCAFTTDVPQLLTICCKFVLMIKARNNEVTLADIAQRLSKNNSNSSQVL